MFEAFVCVSCMIVGLLSVSSYAPLQVGLWVAIMSVFVAFNTSYDMGSLMSYILLLIYVGSFLVVFGLIICLLPRQEFKKVGLSGLGLVPVMMWFLVIDLTAVGCNVHFTELGYEGYAWDFSCYSPGAIMYVFMGGFLCFTMLLLGHVCSNTRLPLRPIEDSNSSLITVGSGYVCNSEKSRWSVVSEKG